MAGLPRDSSDDLGLALMRCAWRLDALDQWRERIDHDLAACRQDIDGMISADTIADAVAARAKADAARVWSWPRKCAVAVGGLIVAVGGIAQILSSFGVIR